MEVGLTKRVLTKRGQLITVTLLALMIGALLAACGGDDEAEVVNHDEQSRLNLGDPAPAFTLPTASGGTVSLADYQEEMPVLLFFHMAGG